MEKLCVLGLGYVGLPTAAMFATHGFQVVGVDVDDRVVEALNKEEIHINEPGLKTLVQAALKAGLAGMAMVAGELRKTKMRSGRPVNHGPMTLALVANDA